MNSVETNHPNTQRIITLACAVCTSLVILLIMNRDYPMVGHDYAYFVPHLMDTGIHMRLHGLSIQWYTPGFGGGLPAYPNPQHMEYSIVQFISLLTDPWTAVLISTALISLVGYYYFYKFLSQNLGLNWMASTLGAMFFIGNGFYIEHLIAGQMGYQLFPFFAIILYTLTDPGRNYIYYSAIISVIIALTIHQAGFYLIVILILSLGITLPLLYLYKPQMIDLKKLGWLAVFSLVLAGTMAASKLYAALAFMRHFPREAFDEYNVGIFQGMIGMAAQLLGVMNLTPFLSMANHDPGILTGILIKMTGAEYGIWETDTGLSPVLIIFLGAAIIKFIRGVLIKPRIQLGRPQLFALILLALATWITVDFSLANGIIYSATKQLPILRSMHINVRFVSAFIVPLIIIGTYELDRFFLERGKLLRFTIVALVTTLFLCTYFALSAPIHIRQFDASIFAAFQKDIQKGKILPVKTVEDISVWQGFAPAATSIKAYEPIFGYKLEEFKPQIKLGRILEIEDGYFNMTNPASLVYPEINQTFPFERIKEADRDKLQIFLNRGQPDWNLPLAQRILNWVSMISFLLCSGIILREIVNRTTH